MNRSSGRWRSTIAVTLLAIAVVIATGNASAVVFEPRDFASDEHHDRYRRLTEELRCLVCQNQNLADSGAGLAGDLRKEVFRMVSEGHDDQAVADFMVARYGHFVLYRPPFDSTTVLLWAGPAVLVLIGIAALAGGMLGQRRARARRRRTAPESRARIAALLDEDSDAGEHA